MGKEQYNQRQLIRLLEAEWYSYIKILKLKCNREKLSKEEKEIQAVKDKYDETIKAAKLANIETGIIEEGKREELALIDAKYRELELEEFEKQEKRKQEILDGIGVEGLEAKIKAIEKKQLRQNHKKKARNDHFRALYREARIAFEAAIKNKDAKTAKALLVNKKDKDGKTVKSGLQSIIDKLVKKNIIHKNNAARKKANFVKMMKALS